MSKVFHAIRPNFGLGENPNWPEGYELVAEVDSDDVDDAFRLTNHIDVAWYENEGVTVHKQARSTSVGDIIENNDGIFRCMPVGWEKLNERKTSEVG